ncbi:MAG: transporter [Massilibacteroides sp.]|nr:transporter [Massilibacteroides sp.]MDD3062741.1 transporter [Massilibacteroides sp.]MDD4114171.1 transporter [Massilibacteroides sp.]MDD4661285.1 transporter [Massilibacteroides sp.]
MFKFIKEWMLPIAMFFGAVTYPISGRLAVLTPYLIFSMLLLTFCKLSPREIRFHPAHAKLLAFQLIGCVLIYVALYKINPIIAQGAMICVLAPTATSAAVITGMLGGSVAFLTSYLIFCNIAVAIAAPLLFPLFGSYTNMLFFDSVLYICKEVGPVLILPLITAWILRYGFPKIHERIVRIHLLSFYLWALALLIVTGRTVKFLIEQENPNYSIEISCAAVSLVICCGQFLLGRKIGSKYNDPVSSGQGLGQKNTILAIWMAQIYLNPISSVAPAGYVLWQNIINSYQLWLRNKRITNKQ